MKDEIVIRRTYNGKNIEKHIERGRTEFFELSDNGLRLAEIYAAQKQSYVYKCYTEGKEAQGYCVPK